MDRKPEHLAEDSLLRPDYVVQTSWDEWAAVNTPFFLHPLGREMVEAQMRSMGMDANYEDTFAVAIKLWMDTIDPETNMAELLYLQGFNRTERLRIIDVQHAELLRRAVEIGLIPERKSDVDFREQFGD